MPAPTTDRRTDMRSATVIARAHPMPGASRTPPLQATCSWDASSVPSPCPITVRVNGRDLNGAPATQSPKPKYVLLLLFDMRGFILRNGQAFHPSLTLKS